MSPLFMDTGYDPNNSPGSLSAEECHSNTAGSEREGERQQMGPRVTKRREKNRDAARKSRKKQTERADELHEELQCLEQSNAALQKEIAALKKDLQFYKTALELHEPNCHLTASASSSGSSALLSVSSSADCQISSNPPKVPPQASNSTLAAFPPLSASLTSSLGLQTLDCIERTHVIPSATTPTTTASSAGSSAELFTASSSSVTVPYSAPFCTNPATHSLFSEELLITSEPTNVLPASSSLVPDAALSTAARPQSGQDTIHETASVSAHAFFTFLEEQNTSAVAQGCPMNVPQLHSSCFSGNPNGSCTLIPSALVDPAPQESSELSPAPPFALKPSYNREVSPNPAPLLSLLTVPSPLNVSQTTSSSFHRSLAQPLPPPPLGPLEPLEPLPPLGDPSKDLSLSELLEINDWILNATSNQ